MTFEIQKNILIPVEKQYLVTPEASYAWILIQRITLPIAIFFRFHSAQVSIDLWHEVYHGNEIGTRDNKPKINTQGMDNPVLEE